MRILTFFTHFGILFIFLFSISCKQQDITEDVLYKIANSTEYKNHISSLDEMTAYHLSVAWKQKGLKNGVQQNDHTLIDFADKSEKNEQLLFEKNNEDFNVLMKAYPELGHASLDDFKRIQELFRQSGNPSVLQQVLKVKEIEK